MIDGILPVDKPQGWTSHDVVARVRRLAAQRQVGHAGTLDPLASGLLLLVLGRATRFSNVLMESRKTYLAEIVLGATTVTDDAEAPIQQRCDPTGVTLVDVETILAQLRGEIEQRPPAYAAVKQGGQKLYQLARRGETVEVAPRRVRVHAIDIERWETPRLRLRIECGAGTYIRSIARDLGTELGVGGYLHALRRVRSGAFDVAGAHTLASLEESGVAAAVLPPDWAVARWPAIVADEAGAQKIGHGLSTAVNHSLQGEVRVYAPDGSLLALARADGEAARPYRVMRRGPDAECR